MSTWDDAPVELSDPISEFWPANEWDNAAAIAELESGWNAFAENDTTTDEHGCGDVIGVRDGVTITAERSIGFFQINSCNLPAGWHWEHLFNAKHNAGTAHKLWDDAGQSWRPWYFSAVKLGLIKP